MNGGSGLLCRLVVHGALETHWSAWFDDLAIEQSGGDTVLHGELADPAALFGLLARVRDLGLPLILFHAEPAPHRANPTGAVVDTRHRESGSGDQ